MKKRSVFAAFLVAMPIFTAYGPLDTASAANVVANITRTQNNGNSATVEFSVPMADSDVLFRSGFEGSEAKFITDWVGKGNQSYVTTSDGHGTVLQLTNTMYPKSGNLYDPGLDQKPDIYSMAQIGIPSVRKDSMISVQYDYKQEGGSQSGIYAFFGDLRFEQGREFRDNAGRVVKFRNSTKFQSGTTTPYEIPVYTDEGPVDLNDFAQTGATYVLTTSPLPGYQWNVIRYTFDKSRNVLVRHKSNTVPWEVPVGATDPMSFGLYTFNPGDSVRELESVGDITSGEKSHNPAGWGTYSLNFDVAADLRGYDSEKYGVKQYVRWYTDGVSQLDNFKVGYAEKAMLYRNGQQVYSGFDSKFTDNQANDTTAPPAVSNLNYSFLKGSKQVSVKWNANEDLGTDYTYTIQGQLRDGTVGSVQDPKVVNVKSGIKGYIVRQTDNPNSTITGGDIATTASIINILPEYGKNYLQVAAVDNAGNIGATSTVQMVDTDNPVVNLTASPTTPTKYGVSINVSATDNTTWVYDTQTPDFTVKGGITSFVASENGTYTVISRDALGNVGTKSITITNIDKIAPGITITPNGATWQADAVNAEVNITDNFPLAGGKFQYIVTNSSTVPAAGAAWITSNTAQFPVEITQEGQWYLHVKATDAAGNTTTKTSSVYQIKALPEAVNAQDVSWMSPSSDSVRIDVPAKAGVSYDVSVSNGQSYTIPEGSGTLLIPGLEGGSDYKVTITPRNVSGAGQSTEITVMTRPEQVQIKAVTPVQGKDGSVTLEVYGVKGADNYIYKLGYAAGETVSEEKTSSTTMDYNLQPNQRYTVLVEAENSQGRSIVNSRTFLTVPTLTGLAVVDIKEEEVTLQWDTVTGDTYYDVNRNDKFNIRVDNTNNTVSGDTYGSVNGVTTFTDRNLTAGDKYTYSISANNDSGASVYRSVSTQTLPSQPEVSSTNITTNSVTLRWEQQNGVDAYDVYQDGDLVAKVTGNQWSTSNLTDGTGYMFQVVAKNNSGSSKVADELVLTVPGKPNLGTVKNYTDTSATIEVAEQSGVEEWVATGSTGTFTSSTRDIDVSGMEPGTVYTFNVSTKNGTGESVKTSVTVETLPGKITGEKVSKATEKEVTLVWDKVKGATSYLVTTPEGVKTVNAPTITLPTPGAGQITGYTVQAQGATGVSPYSATISYQGAPTAPDGASNGGTDGVVTVTGITYQSAVLQWKSFAGATGYNIYDGDTKIGETTDTKYPLDKLISSTLYPNYRVEAVNEQGYTSDRYGVQFETAPYSGFSVEVKNITKSSVDLHYTGVAANDVIVIARKDVNGWVEVYRGKDAVVTLDGLSDNSWYTLRTWTENSKGTGSDQQEMVFKTQEKRLLSDPGYGVITKPNDNDTKPEVKPVPNHNQNDTPTVGEGINDISFDDVVGRYSEDAINYLVNKGIIEGYDSNLFKPKAGITRAEFVTMLSRAGYLDHAGDTASIQPFKDTATGWFAEDVAKAQKLGIINGYLNNTFKPNQVISRAEAAKVISKIGIKGEEEYTFTDESKLPDWAKEDIAQVGGTIFQGYQDGEFKPNRSITREETALVVYRLLTK